VKNLKKIADFGRFSKCHKTRFKWSPWNINIPEKSLGHKFHVSVEKTIVTQVLRFFTVWGMKPENHEKIQLEFIIFFWKKW